MEPENQKRLIFITALVIIAAIINTWFLTRDYPVPVVQPSAKEVEQQKVESDLAAKEAAERVAQNAKAEHEKYLARYIDNTFTKTAGKKCVAILVVSDSGNPSNSFKDELRNHLDGSGVRFLPSFFNSPFITEGFFQNTFNGSSEPITKLDLHNFIDGMVLARQHLEFSKNNSELANTITANVSLEVAIVPVGDAVQSQTRIFSGTGVGFSQADAQSLAVERIIKQINADTKLTLQ